MTHHTTHTTHTAHTSHSAHPNSSHAPLSSSTRAAGSSHNLLAAQQAALNASKNEHYVNGNGGSNKKLSGAAAMGNVVPSGQELIIQLATTRKMLRNILEKHDAVPDRVSNLLFF